MKRPDESRGESVREWFVKAEEDFLAASHLLEETPGAYPSVIAFLSQQTAEKYLKAFLAWHDVDFPKTYALGVILDLVATVDHGLSESLHEATLLTAYGVPVRYPWGLPKLSISQVKRAFEIAGEVRKAVFGVLRDQV
jgi:HEPN domain-containing protein